MLELLYPMIQFLIIKTIKAKFEKNSNSAISYYFYYT